jgi:hypothetical protein
VLGQIGVFMPDHAVIDKLVPLPLAPFRSQNNAGHDADMELADCSGASHLSFGISGNASPLSRSESLFRVTQLPAAITHHTRPSTISRPHRTTT